MSGPLTATRVKTPRVHSRRSPLTGASATSVISTSSEEEMVALMRLAQQHLSPSQLWVNPDCGLKTRKWEEVRPAIDAMVAAARTLRAEVTVDA